MAVSPTTQFTLHKIAYHLISMCGIIVLKSSKEVLFTDSCLTAGEQSEQDKILGSLTFILNGHKASFSNKTVSFDWPNEQPAGKQAFN